MYTAEVECKIFLPKLVATTSTFSVPPGYLLVYFCTSPCIKQQLFKNFLVYSDTFMFCLSGRLERQTSKNKGTERQKRPLWLTLVTWSSWGKYLNPEKENFCSVSANFSSEIGSSHLTQTSLSL